MTTIAGSGALAFADGVGTNAKFWNPFSVKCDSSGVLWVADTSNDRIRKLVMAPFTSACPAGSYGSGSCAVCPLGSFCPSGTWQMCYG